MNLFPLLVINSFTILENSLEITGLKDNSLADLDNLPEPDELAEENIENMEQGWRVSGRY